MRSVLITLGIPSFSAVIVFLVWPSMSIRSKTNEHVKVGMLQISVAEPPKGINKFVCLKHLTCKINKTRYKCYPAYLDSLQ